MSVPSSLKSLRGQARNVSSCSWWLCSKLTLTCIVKSEVEAHERLYSDFSKRKAAQRRTEHLKHLEEQDMKFVPERVTKSKDKKFGLDKEPFYEKFNRLYQDHEKKARKSRKQKQIRDQEDRKKHNFNPNRGSLGRKSQGASSSAENRRSRLSSLIRSPEEIQRRAQELVEKVNREEGCTFQPKVNTKMNNLLVDPNSDVISRNKEFVKNRDNKILAMKCRTVVDDSLESSGQKTKPYPSIYQYRDLAACKSLSEEQLQNINSRYSKTHETFSKVTEEDIEEDKEFQLTAQPVSTT